MIKNNFKISKEFKELFLLVLFLCSVTILLLYEITAIKNTDVMPTFWTIYGFIATSFLISRIPYAYLHKDNHDNIYSADMYPNVSTIIACKNEEDGIFKTIATCIDSKYEGKIECIIIDDGSTDGTKYEIIRAQKHYGDDKVKLIVFEVNKGKREAMAVGIAQAQYEIICFIDSDSFVAPDGIHHMVEHFMANPKVGAVAGNTKVENIDANVLTKLQSIQYAVSFDLYKASESVYRSVTCCPGCFSAYRREAVLEIVDAWRERMFLGSRSTFGDDRGLTNSILQKWDVVYCEKAKATTTVPEKFSKYWKQQIRWKKSWIREGTFASLFMWKKRHPIAALAFYINFTFPLLGPVFVATLLIRGIQTHNLILFVVFIIGFILLGLVFSLFVRVYHGLTYWLYTPLYSFLFVSVLIWQMPYALLTLRNTGWGTR